jgi:MFS family permease
MLMNLKLLKNKDLLLLIWGKFISMLGTNLQKFTLSLYVLKTTGSASKFASVLAVSIIPQLLLGPFVGVFADWIDRKKIIVTMDILSGIVVGIMAVLYLIMGELQMSYIYMGVFLLSIISVMFQPAACSVIPSIINKQDLMDANSISSLSTSVSQILAPLLAGVIYGIYGLLPILIINSTSFILSAISEMFIIIPKLNRKIEKFDLNQFKKDFIEGISYTVKNKDILTVAICAFVINFVLGPMFSLGVTYIAKKVLLVSDIQYGLMQTILAFGMICGPLFAGIVAKRIEIKKIFKYGVMTAGLLIGGMAFCITPIFLNFFNDRFVPFILIIVLGTITVAVMILINISLSTMFQKQVSIEMLGRTGAVFNVLATAAMPLGQIVFGRLFDTIPAYIPVIIICVIMIATAIGYGFSVKKQNGNVQLNIDTEL